MRRIAWLEGFYCATSKALFLIEAFNDSTSAHEAWRSANQ
jgi:hypothetical protein